MNYLENCHTRLEKLLSGEPLSLFVITQCMPDPEESAFELSTEENEKLHKALFKFVGFEESVISNAQSLPGCAGHIDLNKLKDIVNHV